MKNTTNRPRNLTHARRLFRHAQQTLSTHLRECVTCSPGRACSLAMTLRETAELRLEARRGMERVRDGLAF